MTEPLKHDPQYEETEAQRQGRLYKEQGRRHEVQKRRRAVLGARYVLPTREHLAHAEKCQRILAEQTRQSSHDAAVWLANYKREQETENENYEAAKLGMKACTDCGREIDNKYDKCYRCHSNGP